MYLFCTERQFIPGRAIALIRNLRRNRAICAPRYRGLEGLDVGLHSWIPPLGMFMYHRHICCKSIGKSIPSRTLPLRSRRRNFRDRRFLHIPRLLPQHRRRRFHIILGPTMWSWFHRLLGLQSSLGRRLGFLPMIATLFSQLV